MNPSIFVRPQPYLITACPLLHSGLFPLLCFVFSKLKGTKPKAAERPENIEREEEGGKGRGRTAD